MSTPSVWDSPTSYRGDESYPSSLLKYLLQHMMTQFGAHGACIALFDEISNQMTIQLHVHPQKPNAMPGGMGLRLPSRHMATTPLGRPPSLSGQLQQATTRPLSFSPIPELTEARDSTAIQQGELFAVGTSYAKGECLIGDVWEQNKLHVLLQDEYLQRYHVTPLQQDDVPLAYLALPIQEAQIGVYEQTPAVLGVIVLYQTVPVIGPNFPPKQCAEALAFTERIALYLQNDKLQRSHRRTNYYLQRLQDISIAFPTNVSLPSLLERVYDFASQVADVSSLLLTFYDRDTDRIYDVFAVQDGLRVADFTEQPIISRKDERPMWWHVTQEKKQALMLAPAKDTQDPDYTGRYDELLTGVWGDQRRAASFLLLPMKMFNRVVGSLCLTSKRPDAYTGEEKQVLETMVQIITVSIENVKLYERDRGLLQQAQEREAQLAAINSALQSIGPLLNLKELLNTFVNSVAALVKVEMCVFFQLSPEKEELVAEAFYAPPSMNPWDDGSPLPNTINVDEKGKHDDLIAMIRLPFKGTTIEQSVGETFFYLDQAGLEELAQQSQEGGVIFLQETHIQQILMIPMSYHAELIGILAIPTKEVRFFKPKDVGTLLAICAQATSAIRNAHLVEQQELAYAELQRLDKLKDEFLVTASHELRTPLSAIAGYSTLLKRHSACPHQILRYAGKISNAAQQLTSLLTSMTEAAKMGMLDKNLNMQIGDVQLQVEAEIAAGMLSVNIEQQISISIDSSLWVCGDRLRVRQVITNLLDNAAKYSPPHAQIQVVADAMTYADVVPLLPQNQVDHVLLVERSEAPMVMVRVHDRGEGIEPLEQEKIFEKFFRASRSLTTSVRGSGLGLYICRRCIEAMGGRLWLERSNPHEGSVFSFYLPRRIETPVTAEEQDAGLVEPSDNSDIQGATV